LRRALGKPHPRVVGVDDGAFERGDRYAPLAAVAVTLPEHVEAIGAGHVRVDGSDATARVVALVRRLGPLDGVRAVLLDGVVFGGFNVVDLDELHRSLELPIVAVTRRPPDFPKIHDALRKWFPRTAAGRWKILRAHRLFPVTTTGKPILATAVGCSRLDARWLVQRATVRGHWPESLRIAHLIASAQVGGARFRPKG
jgi:uncharacterized protein